MRQNAVIKERVDFLMIRVQQAVLMQSCRK
jgi:hypothetical protein